MVLLKSKHIYKNEPTAKKRYPYQKAVGSKHLLIWF